MINAVKITDSEKERDMFNKERKPDTLKQKRTRQYVRILLGMYLMYTAFNMGRDLKSGVAADNTTAVLAATVLFAVFGAVLCVTAFIGAMKISAEELKEKESLPEDMTDVQTENGTAEPENASVEAEEGEKGEP